MTEQRNRAYEFLKENKVNGSQLAEALGIPSRSARRYVSEFPSKSKIGQWAVFDIETTDLSAVGRAGFLVCCSILPLDAEKPHTHAITFEENSGNDKRLLQDVLSDLNQYDFLIGHNINGYDLQWLDTRRAIHRLPPLRKWFIFDTLHVAQSLAWRTEHKSLAWLCDALGIPCIKTAIYKSAWNEIRSPDKVEFENTLKNIVFHCEEDTLATKRLFEFLWKPSFNLSQSPIKMWSRGNAPA